MDSLKFIIVQDAAFSSKMASYQTWLDQNGEKASLNELSQKSDDAQNLVSEYTFIGLEIPECDGVVLFEFIS